MTDGRPRTGRRRARATVRARQPDPLGADRSRRMASTFRVYARARLGLDLLLFDAVDDEVPARVIRLDPRGQPDRRLLAREVPRDRAPASSTASRPTGRGRPRDGLRFDATGSCSTRTARGVAIAGRATDASSRRTGTSLAVAR